MVYGSYDRGEYFYLVGGAHLQLILFSLCRNIQFGVFRAEIFILWCIVQKILVRYRYMLHGHHNLLFGFDQCLWNASLSHGKMRQNNELHADLASFLFNCARKNAFFGVRAEILLFWGFVQKYYSPKLLHPCYLVQGLF